MAYNTNIVVVSGNLARDPEMKYTQDGKAILNGSIAVNEGKDKCSFFDFTAFEKTAEFVNQYLKKGDAVIINGRLQQQKWEKDGVKHYAVKIIANNIESRKRKDDKPDEIPEGA